MKQCKVCKKEFKPKANNGSLCSDFCKKENKKIIMRIFKEKNPTYFKKYELTNNSRLSKYRQEWYRDNCNKKAQYNKKWSELNRDFAQGKDKEYYLKNKDKLIEQARVYSLKRRNVDPEYKLRKNLRKRLHYALKNNKKVGSAVKDLGCSISELKTYLESKFLPDMNWENYGKWHIDHIVPLSSFNLSNPEELKKACHFTNLQPLWAKDNLKKSNRPPKIY